MADILSIEDDVTTSRLIRRVLEKAGHNMQHAPTGEVALDMLSAKSPDLVLLDINIPDINGYTICKKIRANPAFKDVPVVFLSANISDEEKDQAFQVGASDFIEKPIQPHAFVKSIEQHLSPKTPSEESPASDSPPEPTPEPEKTTPVVPHAEPEETTKDQPPEKATPNTSSQEVPDSPKSSRAWQADKSQALALARTRSKSKPVEFETQEQQVSSAYSNSVKEVATVGSKSTPKADNLSNVVPDFSRFVAFLIGVTQKKDTVSTGDFNPMNLYSQASALEISQYEMAKFVSGFTKIKYLASLDGTSIEKGLLSEKFCRKHHILPINFEHELTFVIAHPFDIELQDALRRFKNAKVLISEPDIILQAFTAGVAFKPESKPAVENDLSEVLDELSDQYHDPLEDLEEDLEAIDENTDENDAPMIRLVNGIIENAYLMGASDIHIEPQERKVNIRYRIDGELKVINEIKPLTMIRPIVARIKVMSQLDLAERRLPQDGRIAFKEYGRQRLDFDLRVATAPMKYGEKVVMRILDKQKSTLPLEKLGFSERNLYLYRRNIHTPYGLVLHVGPTGSGKSMTLYSALSEIYRPELNIQTAEDPIEYTLPGINQLQVKPDIGLTFGRVLRSYLRQDPDVILVGEIRDLETAHIAIEAAMTGHLLLSTLHTNDAASTMMRLLEMGIEPFLISSSLVMVCAQRLLRRLCRHCCEAYTPDSEEQYLVGLDKPTTLYQPVGCEQCNHLGYKGRVGIHEILVPNDEIRQMMTQSGITSDIIKQTAVQSCEMTTLYWDGMDKVRQGITSVDEVLTRVRPDDFDSRPEWLKTD